MRLESLSYPSFNSPIAQSVEQMTVNHWVAGSSPARGAKEYEGCSDAALFHFWY